VLCVEAHGKLREEKEARMEVEEGADEGIGANEGWGWIDISAGDTTPLLNGAGPGARAGTGRGLRSL
jgi:hypothetical protein